MSAAQVTDDTKRLALRVYEAILTERDDDACQLIADSEAKATEELRAEVDAQCLLNAKGSEREAVLLRRVDRMAKECLNLRADLDAIKTIRDEEKARAERAEAELNALRLICGTTDADRFSTWVDRANARAEEAEHDCRVLIVQLNVAKDELAKAKAIIASIEEDGTEEHNAAVSLRQELAAERARRDWLGSGFWITGEPCDRAAIDAAIKEEKP